MRSVWVSACAMLLVSVAVFAAPAPKPSPAPLSDAALAAILGAAPGPAACGKPQPAAPARRDGLALKYPCAAICWNGSTVTCNGTTCQAINGDCSYLEAGQVTCNGVTTHCTPACCTTGTARDKACCRCNATGSCMDCCRCDGGTIGQCAAQCG